MSHDDVHACATKRHAQWARDYVVVGDVESAARALLDLRALSAEILIESDTDEPTSGPAWAELLGSSGGEESTGRLAQAGSRSPSLLSAAVRLMVRLTLVWSSGWWTPRWAVFDTAQACALGYAA